MTLLPLLWPSLGKTRAKSGTGQEEPGDETEISPSGPGVSSGSATYSATSETIHGISLQKLLRLLLRADTWVGLGLSGVLFAGITLRHGLLNAFLASTLSVISLFFLRKRVRIEELNPWLGSGFLMITCLLVSLLWWGEPVRNVRAWIRIGPLSLQPSEPAKLIFLLWIARLWRKGLTVENFCAALGGVSVLTVLVSKQPDFGTAMFFPLLFVVVHWVSGGGVWFYMSLLGFSASAAGVLLYSCVYETNRSSYAALTAVLISAGLVAFCIEKIRKRRIVFSGVFDPLRPPKKPVVALLLFVLGTGVMSGGAAYTLMKPYQVKRVQVFFHPERDLRGVGYNQHQAKIAIGSGGLSGKGIGAGTQGRLGFLPEAKTDFIFSQWAEETGWIGSIFILICFLLWTTGGLRIALYNIRLSRQRFLLATGLTTLVTLPAIINLWMEIGWFPVVGIPLPFLSRGGSALITDLTAALILLSLYQLPGETGWLRK